jgi:glycosyltransferase involved in cell wall biosynthesis
LAIITLKDGELSNTYTGFFMKVSIITVALNSAEYIEDCIKSVVSQDYKDIEYIVIDGASTDGTIDVIRKYEKYVSLLISEPDHGIYDAMNKGIKIATGEIIGILNSDDMYADETVIRSVANCLSEDGIGTCYGDLVYVDRNNTDKLVRYWKSGDFNKKKFKRGWMPPHPTFFVRRGIYEQYGVFNLELGSAADYELMLRFLLRHMIKTKYLPEVLIKMRTGGISNISIKMRLIANYMDRYAWKVNDLKPYPWTLIFKPLRKINQYCFHK